VGIRELSFIGKTKEGWDKYFPLTRSHEEANMSLIKEGKKKRENEKASQGEGNPTNSDVDNQPSGEIEPIQWCVVYPRRASRR